MSKDTTHEHEQKSKEHAPHAPHEVHPSTGSGQAKNKGPRDPNEINPKLASDIAFWAKEFHVTGEKLHEAIRIHGTHVAKVRAALQA
jgi:hypothetical protein